MTLITFMKIVSDLGFYFTFAGFFAMLAGASDTNMLISLFVMGAAFSASFMLREKGSLRFLPLLVSLLCLFLPNTNIAGIVVLMPPILYSLYVVLKNAFHSDWGQQVSIFSLFWKLFLVFIGVCAVAGKLDIAYSFVIPCGVVTLCCQVLLTRSLRHEEEVFTSKKYQLLNASIIIIVCLVALFLSSDVFLGAVTAVIKAIYTYILNPIFTVIIYAIIAVMQLLSWLFSFIKINFETKENTVTLNTSGAEEIFGSTETNYSSTGELLDKLSLAVALIAAAVIVVLLFKYLMKHTRTGVSETKSTEVRYYVEPAVIAEEEPERGSPVQKVRAQYKKFLKHCQNEGILIKKSDTSLDVNYRCEDNFPEADTNELRDIYIEARYNGSATKDDAARAKELLSRIKKS